MLLIHALQLSCFDLAIADRRSPRQPGAWHYSDICWGAAVFNCLLEVCARTNDQERGYNIIEQMEKAGCIPDEYTVEAVAKRKVLRSHLRRVFTDSEGADEGY